MCIALEYCNLGHNTLVQVSVEQRDIASVFWFCVY